MTAHEPLAHAAETLAASGGAMGRLIADHDWSTSPLGPLESWPAALHATVRLMLPANAQIVLFWGPDLVALYNDAYAPTIGDKHPSALGTPARIAWAELWDDLGPLLEGVRSTGETFFAKDRPFYIERHGYGEEVFFDISYSAVRVDDGSVGGVLCLVSETTERVRAELRTREERERLARMFEQAPGFMALLGEPGHVYELANAAYRQLIGDRPLLGQSVREALPELEGQGFFELLDQVAHSGKPFAARSMSVSLRRREDEAEEERLLDFVYQPITDETGTASAIFVQGTDVTEHARALEAQRESEARLLAIANSVDQMIWSTRPDGYHDYFNQRWYDFTGLPAGAIDGAGWNDVFHPDDRSRAWEVWRRSLATGEPYYIEYRLRHRSGAYRWVLGRAQPVRDAAGRVARWFGTCTDIHDLKATEAALRESRDQLATERNALEILNRTAARVAAELDLDRLVQTVVDAGVELTGAQFGAFFYNVVNAAGESYMLYALAGVDRSAFSSFPMPRNTAVFAPTFGGAGVVRSDNIQADPRYGQSEPHRGQPPGHLPVRSYLAVPVTSRSGEVIGGLFFGHERIGVFAERHEDLMAGLAAQAATGIDNARLFRAEQQLNQTLEQEVADRTRERDGIWQLSQDLLGVAGGDGIWRSVNPAWTRVLGWSAAEIVGRTSEWLEHPDDREKTRAEIARLGDGAITYEYENRFRTRDGDYRTLSWRAVPYGGELYCVARDVTEERRQAAALVETEERLRQAQKMETVGQLTGGLAHDFNNLLQVISGNLETLLRRLPEDDPRLRRAAENAMSGASRAAVLTQRLLAFARRQPLQPKRIDGNALVAGMSDLLHRTLGEPVAIATALAPDLWPIEADPNQLENAILNLAVNARDAMPGGGKLTIETSNAQLDRAYADRVGEVNPGDYAMICVSDTGEGMDAATIARAFEPFFTTKEVGKGTGLGLSMVYGFVKQSGGHVRVYSEPGHGTSVKIYLPRTDVEAVHEAEHMPEEAGRGRHDETILVCEDDADVRAYSAGALRELGYRVLEAQDGASALALLRSFPAEINLLFSDVVLPNGMTGADLAREARAICPHLRILFTTGYARNAIVHHGRLDSGVELITKPFAYGDLAARVRALLDARAPD